MASTQDWFPEGRGRSVAVRTDARPTFDPPLTPIHLYLVLLGSMLAVTLNVMGIDPAFQALVLLLTLFSVIRALFLVRVHNVRLGAVPVPLLLLGIVVASALVSGSVSGNHVYVVFAVSLATAVWLDRRLDASRLLAITNVSFLIFLAGSILVYAGVLDLGRNLNVFEASSRVPGLQFRTFVGLYGSTAHIDSIAMFVALVNVVHGRGRWRGWMVALAVAASAATLRYTPLVSLVIALSGMGVTHLVAAAPALRRAVAGLIAAMLVSSAFLTVWVTRFLPFDAVEAVANVGTNGRSRIWSAMLERFASETSFLQKAFGAGTTESYLVGGWWRLSPVSGEWERLWTQNPHNSYLAVALTLGATVFVMIIALAAYVAARTAASPDLAPTLFVLTVGITNAEVLTFHFPIYLAWLALLAREARTGRVRRPKKLRAPPSDKAARHEAVQVG
jgi:hypothetical protein